jgi:hypothetical protein
MSAGGDFLSQTTFTGNSDMRCFSHNQLLHLPAADDHFGRITLSDADKDRSRQHRQLRRCCFEDRRGSKVHKRGINAFAGQELSHDIRWSMAHTTVRGVNHLPAFGFKDVARVRDGEAIRLNQLRVCSTVNDAPFHREIAASLKSSTDNGHDAAPGTAGLTKFDRLSNLSTDFERKGEARRVCHTQIVSGAIEFSRGTSIA